MNNKFTSSLIFERKAGSFNALESSVKDLNLLVDDLDKNISRLARNFDRVKSVKKFINSSMEELEKSEVEIKISK